MHRTTNLAFYLLTSSLAGAHTRETRARTPERPQQLSRGVQRCPPLHPPIGKQIKVGGVRLEGRRRKALQTRNAFIFLYNLRILFYIMCLYPKLIRNPKYKANKKNNGYAPMATDERVLYVPVGCGKCIECRRQKAHEWQTRMHQELKTGMPAYFVTLTFSEESLTSLSNELKVSECNAVAGLAVRRFLERWRKIHKKSLRHWLITELGHTGTERIHLHGIIFTNEEFNNTKLENIWKYGITYTGTFCNERTINYVVKYVTKVDNDHKGFEGQIFCSAGIGRIWCNSDEFARRHYKGENTIEYITLPNGCKMNTPIYYRNKLYSDEEREKLWLQKMDKQEIYLMGIRYDISTVEGIERLNKVREQRQIENLNLGFGSDAEEWKKKDYNVTLRKLNAKQKLQNAQKTTKT